MRVSNDLTENTENTENTVRLGHSNSHFSKKHEKIVSMTNRLPLLFFALLCVSCASGQQPFLRIELEKRAQDIVRPQTECAERKARHIDNCVSDAQSAALNLSMHCRHEYEKATENYAKSFLDNDEQRKIFRERRNNIQEKIEAFLPFVTENRMHGFTRSHGSALPCRR
jgi:hypothetical protein